MQTDLRSYHEKMERRHVVIVVRHGQSEANVADLVVSKPENGCPLYGLTELGHQQAAQAGKEIQQWLNQRYGKLRIVHLIG